MKPQIEITELEWDIIETYLGRNMASDKEPKWNKELDTIPDVVQKIEHVKQVNEEIEDRIRQLKIKEFQQHVAAGKEEDLDTKDPKGRKMGLNPMWYAAAAVLVVMFGILWLMQNRNTPEQIFATHFKPDIGLPLRMGATNSHEFYEGMVDYKQKQYKDAISKWEILVKANPENDTLNYFLGVAHLAQGQAEKSLGYLQDQDLFQQSIFKEDAAYYAALAYIKEGDFKQAARVLKKHPSQRNTHLLKELEKE